MAQSLYAAVELFQNQSLTLEPGIFELFRRPPQNNLTDLFPIC